MPIQGFRATRDYRTRHTEVFDFVTPVAAGLWNLRWQVQGFVGAVPDASVPDLQGRFLAGSGIRANLRRAAIEHTWEQQTEQLGRFSLYVFVALYEAWLDEIVSLFPSPVTMKKWMQFPSKGTYGSTSEGVREALTELRRLQSPTLARNFDGPLRAQSDYQPALDEMLVCFRYFKECRNALLHRGGRAHDRLVEAARHMGTITKKDLGVGAMPEHVAFGLDEDVRVSFRGATGFSAVLLRLVATLDTELATTTQAEDHLLSLWRGTYGRVILPKEASKREKRVTFLCSSLGWPRAQDPQGLLKLLQDSNLVF